MKGVLRIFRPLKRICFSFFLPCLKSPYFTSQTSMTVQICALATSMKYGGLRVNQAHAVMTQCELLRRISIKLMNRSQTFFIWPGCTFSLWLPSTSTQPFSPGFSISLVESLQWHKSFDRIYIIQCITLWISFLLNVFMAYTACTYFLTHIFLMVSILLSSVAMLMTWTDATLFLAKRYIYI